MLEVQEHDGLNPFWGTDVDRLVYFYDHTDDTIFIAPLDDEGVIREEAGIGVEAAYFPAIIDMLISANRDAQMMRRIIRKAVKKGVDPVVVQNRFEARFIANATNYMMQKAMVDGVTD